MTDQSNNFEEGAAFIPGSSFVAHQDGVTLSVLKFDDMTPHLLGETTRLCDAQVAEHPALLNRLDVEKVAQENAIFAVATDGMRLNAVVHATLETCHDAPLLKIGGLVSDGTRRGIGTPLLASLIVGAATILGAEPGFEAHVRILPNGAANVASAKTLMRLGGYLVRMDDHPVTLKNPQKGVAGSAEGNGGELRYALFRGDSGHASECAFENLMDW